MTVRTENDKLMEKNKNFTIFDLFRFESLKKKTIYLSILLFFLASLYMGPNSILDYFNVDIFWLQVILSLPDIITYPIACRYINNIERRKAGIHYLGLTSVLIFITLFFREP
jgi:hypothetical protein